MEKWRLPDRLPEKPSTTSTCLTVWMGADNAACRYGEIAVPVDFLASYSDARGIHIRIPYVADIRLLKVRIAMKSGSGGSDMYVVQLTAGIGFPS